MKEALLILFGFALAQLPEWVKRRRRLRTHWSAVRAELQLCCEKAGTFLQDAVQSPLYRLPLLAYKTPFPVLLAEGALSETDALTIGRFFSRVQDINRGLDNAAALLNVDDESGQKREYVRNCIKAKELVESSEGNPSLYSVARNIVDAKITQPWWKY